MEEQFNDIEKFFEGKSSAAEAMEFQKKVEEDPSFAEEVAFYISALRVAAASADEERKARFRQLSTGQAPVVSIGRSAFRRWLPYVSVAACLAVIAILLFLFLPSFTPNRLANRYIDDHLQTLSVTMGVEETNLQAGVRLYNEGKLPQALMHFENALRDDPSNTLAEENAGIVSLRLKQYDPALMYFTRLETDRRLHANPGKFYHALTLLKRNRTGDAEMAKKLLQEVVSDHLDLENRASELLEKL